MMKMKMDETDVAGHWCRRFPGGDQKSLRGESSEQKREIYLDAMEFLISVRVHLPSGEIESLECEKFNKKFLS
jgi:hypothetical protein